MGKISDGKQRETKKSTPEIYVMANALWAPPLHPRKQVKCLEDMRKDDHHQTSCAEKLEEREYRLSSEEQNYRTGKQQARRCPNPEQCGGAHMLRLLRVSQAATWTACHGVRSQPVPVALVGECSIPVV